MIRSDPITAPNWREAVLGGSTVWLLSKVLISLLSLIGMRLRGNAWLQGVGYVNEEGPLLHDPFTMGLHHYDSAYYATIAAKGYFGDGVSSIHQAFFPGFPLTTRALLTLVGATVTPSAVASAMWVVTSVSTLVSAVLMWQLTQHLHPGLARTATGMLLLGPYSVFLAANYPEAEFLAFSLAAWYLGLRGRWLAAGLAAGAATFTRPNGFFLVGGLVVMFCLQWWTRRGEIRWYQALWVAPALGGAAAYLGYLWHVTGDPAAWLHAQATGWGRHSSFPWDVIRRSVQLVDSTPGQWDLVAQHVSNLVFAAVIVAAMVELSRRRAWPELTYVGLTALSLLTSTTLQSISRNTVTLFPITILAAVLVHPGTSRVPRVVRILVGLCWFGMFAYNTLSFALGGWTD